MKYIVQLLVRGIVAQWWSTGLSVEGTKVQILLLPFKEVYILFLGCCPISLRDYLAADASGFMFSNSNCCGSMNWCSNGKVCQGCGE